MTFEHDLRRSLHANAADLDLTGGGVEAVTGRARRRRHRRNAALGTLGAVALTAGTVTVVATREQEPASVAVSTAGLPTAGPLALDWTVRDGGILLDVPVDPAVVTAPDGDIYALSTEPGSTRSSSDGKPDTLYRLDADGDWSSLSSEQMGVELADVAAGSSLLYGISTSPTDRGAGYSVTLSTSSDRGLNWDTTDLPAVELPSTRVGWRPSSTVKVAATGSVAVAAVSTSYWVPPSELPGAEGIPIDELITGVNAEGMVLGRLDRSTSPTGPSDGIGTLVSTVTWKELGINGFDDLDRTDIYVNRGSGWEPVEAGLDQVGYINTLAAVGDGFVVSGLETQLPPASSTQATFISKDGTSWRQIDAVLDYGPVVSLGSSLVVTGSGRTGLQVSRDQGGSWQAIAVPGQELTNGAPFQVEWLTTGPLGLVATITDRESGQLRGVMVTRDLKNWASYDLGGFAERSEGLPGVFIGTDRIVVTVFLGGEGNVNDGSRTRTFIGTPTRVPTSTMVEPDLPPTPEVPTTEPEPVPPSSTTTTTTVGGGLIGQP